MASLGFAAFTAVPVLVVLRLIQGFGLAAVVPSTYSFVPHLARARAQTVAFASLGAAGNAAAAICPPLGIALLQNAGPQPLFIAAAGLATLAGLSAVTVPAPRPRRRPFGLTFRRAWLMPLLVAVLSVAQWGVIQAFVPIEASASGSNPGLLFTADAMLCTGVADSGGLDRRPVRSVSAGAGWRRLDGAVAVRAAAAVERRRPDSRRAC